MRRTTGSCSARLRALPFRGPFDDERRAGDAVGGALPGCTSILSGRPAKPLAAAEAMRRASALNDISIIVFEAGTFATSELPSTDHSAASSMDTSIGCW